MEYSRDILQILSESEPFTGLERGQLAEIARDFTPREFSAGTPIIVRERMLERSV